MRRSILACILIVLPGVVALTEASNPVPRGGGNVRAHVEIWTQEISACSKSRPASEGKVTHPLVVAPSGSF